ncbi:MAG: S41 family peptidase [Chlorobium sp.]|nr:MAG: S41 family peptidase [Chlorobium sp.]
MSKGIRLRKVSLGQKVPGFMAILLFFCLLPVPSFAVTSSQDKEYFDIVKSVDLLGEVYRELSESYVDKLNVSELMYAGIDGMLSTLDPYTVFLDEADSNEFDEQTSGQYVGIGFTIVTLNGKVYVASVVDGYAAAKAGIHVGDCIAAINNKSLQNMELDKVRELIKGVAGTPLSIRIERQGLPTFSLQMKRSEVRVSSVSFSGILDGVGYIEMKSFGTHSSDDLREAFQGLLKQAGEQHITLKGIILDLRNNPGGLLNVAVDVTSLFVSKGSEVVSIRGRLPEISKSYVTATPPLEAVLPLAILINGDSASAAEIVSGAIQDLDRGVIIGERSFGKGLVQSVQRISYDNTLKLTTAKYYTPSGRLIQKESVKGHESRKVLPVSRVDKASKVFYTRGKRKVYGGGGIMPDIEVSEPADSPYLSELRKKGMIFLFASIYRSLHPEMPQQPLERKVLMASFGDFLRDKKFVYATEYEQRVNALKVSMKSVKTETNGSVLKALDELQQAVPLLREQELARQSDGVAQALELEILRHYNEHLARRAELDHDLAVKKARELFADARKYARILHH